jgi:hypothetical protein
MLRHPEQLRYEVHHLLEAERRSIWLQGLSPFFKSADEYAWDANVWTEKGSLTFRIEQETSVWAISPQFALLWVASSV